MTLLLSALQISKSSSFKNLFKKISFNINEGDQVGLIGPNGCGKSTLLRILVGDDNPDEGLVTKRQHLRIGYSCQSPSFPPLSIKEYLLQEAPRDNEIENLTKVNTLLSKAQFNNLDQRADTLSGGWKKRLDIIKACLNDPDLLLLDEPTNHLDIEGIEWLENFLKKASLSSIIVSHDRYFLENVANRIIELNPCYPQGLLQCFGQMSTFMETKEDLLQAQLQQQKGLSSTVRHEKAWLKRSPAARTTKSRSRIQKAYELMDELGDLKRRNQTIKAHVDFVSSERQTRQLLMAKNLTKSIEGRVLFKGLDIKLGPKARLGLVGKNGTGKTTLLKILTGEVAPDKGTIKYAQDLKIVTFDQHRDQIPDHLTLKEALCPFGDTINYRGQQIHINGWAKKCLFAPERLGQPVGLLSGGEKARILLSKLMLSEADILFLDEPTNDLDISTLELIEESLLQFDGAVVLITHDRCLMDRVCNEIVGLGTNLPHPFFADYQQWQKASQEVESKKDSLLKTAPLIRTPSKPSKKLTYMEEKELQGMEASIASIEAEITKLQQELSSPSIHSHASKSLQIYEALANQQQHLEERYHRWQELENKKL